MRFVSVSSVPLYSKRMINCQISRFIPFKYIIRSTRKVPYFTKYIFSYLYLYISINSKKFLHTFPSHLLLMMMHRIKIRMSFSYITLLFRLETYCIFFFLLLFYITIHQPAFGFYLKLFLNKKKLNKKKRMMDHEALNTT